MINILLLKIQIKVLYHQMVYFEMIYIKHTKFFNLHICISLTTKENKHKLKLTRSIRILCNLKITELIIPCLPYLFLLKSERRDGLLFVIHQGTMFIVVDSSSATFKFSLVSSSSLSPVFRYGSSFSTPSLIGRYLLLCNILTCDVWWGELDLSL